MLIILGDYRSVLSLQAHTFKLPLTQVLEDIFNVTMAVRCLKGEIELDASKLLIHLNQLHTNVYAGLFFYIQIDDQFTILWRPYQESKQSILSKQD